MHAKVLEPLSYRTGLGVRTGQPLIVTLGLKADRCFYLPVDIQEASGTDLLIGCFVS